MAETTKVVHFRDVRRDMAISEMGEVLQVPIICAKDLIEIKTERRTHTWTSAHPERVNCPDCRERMEAGR